MEQGKQTTKQTICWGCARALLRNNVACPWTLEFQPVPGWTAIRNDLKYLQYANKGKEKVNESYIVQACPLFLSDADYNKQKKQQEEKIMQQQINTSTTPRMDRFDRNTKTAAQEIVIKEKCISLPSIEAFAAGTNYAAFLSQDGKRLELVKDNDGFTVSATGRGGAGRVIRCEVLNDAMKKRGTVIPQTVAIRQAEDGKWVAELQTAPVEEKR